VILQNSPPTPLLRCDYSYDVDLAKERGAVILQNSPPTPLLRYDSSYAVDLAKERGA